MIDSVARHWLNHPRLRRAALAIRAGGVVAYPTEAVWGLGCDPLNAEAVDTILDLKGRKMAKGVILIAADLAQALPFVAPLTPGDCERLVRPGPGPVTWVVPAWRCASPATPWRRPCAGWRACHWSPPPPIPRACHRPVAP